MRKDLKGNIEYTITDSDSRSLTYQPIEGEDWYLLSIVPSDTYMYDINQFTGFAIIAVTGISIVLLSSLSGAILFITNRKNKFISNIAYVDPVIEGFTKAGFDLKIRTLMEDFSPFTYVVFDIRKFNLIND